MRQLFSDEVLVNRFFVLKEINLQYVFLKLLAQQQII